MIDSKKPTPQEIAKQEIVSKLFPFQEPPQDVIEGTYLIRDKAHQLPAGFHQTSSSILVSPRSDGKLIVPAVALNAESPSLNLKFLLREELPVTHSGARRWASWFGRNILSTEAWNKADYTPDRAKFYLEVVDRIQTIYKEGLQGKIINQNELSSLLGHAVAGFWHKYYASNLPEKIANNNPLAEQEIACLFTSVPKQIANAQHVYEGLDNGSRLLLDKAFNMVFECDLTDQPVTYCTLPYNETLTNPDEPYRDPQEIVSNTRGIKPDKVISVYIPEEVLQKDVGKVALERLEGFGISLDKVQTQMKHKSYDNCLVRYQGGFNGHSLLELVQQGSFQKLF